MTRRFNSKANYAAPIGSKAAGAAFKDTWTLSDVDAEWLNLMEQKHPALQRVLLAAMTNSDKSYLAYMAVRMLEMRRLLKPTGSIYLHCDPDHEPLPQARHGCGVSGAGVGSTKLSGSAPPLTAIPSRG